MSVGINREAKICFFLIKFLFSSLPSNLNTVEWTEDGTYFVQNYNFIYVVH